MLASIPFVLLLLSYAQVIACDDSLHARSACSSTFTACNPKGAATTNEPPIGTGIAPLFVDVVDTIDSANLAKREAGRDRGLVETRASGGGVCCTYLTFMETMLCVDLPSRCRRNYMSSTPEPRTFFLLCERPTITKTRLFNADLLGQLHYQFLSPWRLLWSSPRRVIHIDRRVYSKFAHGKLYAGRWFIRQHLRHARNASKYSDSAATHSIYCLRDR